MLARRVVAFSLLGVLGCSARATLSPSVDASDVAEAGPDVADTAADSFGSDRSAICLTGTVSFTLHVSPASPTSYCVDTCDGEWLSILTADGAQTLGLVDGCLPDCEDNCQPVACPLLCEPPMPFGASGGSTTWDGTFVEYLRCGASIACAHSACAPAGNYIARMCLYAAPPGSETTCQGLATTPTCTDVPFTWPPPPGASSVDGVISGAGPDSGAPD